MRSIRDRVRLTFVLALALAGCNAGEQSVPDSAGTASSETAAGPAGPVAEADCSAVSGVLDRIVCYADLASEAGDRSRCDAAAEEGVRFQCYAIFAERTGDPEPCRAIPPRTQEFVDLRDVCLADVAPVIDSPELCEEIVAPGLKDSCYLNVFRETGDPGLCDLIEDPGLKSVCTGEPVMVTQ